MADRGNTEKWGNDIAGKIRHGKPVPVDVCRRCGRRDYVRGSGGM
jgi:hypothetical protein